MLIKRIFLIVLFFAGLQPVFGQQIEFRPQVGIGTYAMSDLKGLLKESVAQSQLGLKTTENFPAYVFYGLDVVYAISPKFGFGITSGFYSTGGRNHIADYSGSYREDIKVNAINAGLLASFKDTLASHFFYGIELGSGIKFSNISVESVLNISDYNEQSKYDLKSQGWWIEPQLRFGRTFWRRFSCSVFGGYEFNLKSALKLKEGSSNQSKVKIDWSGLRTGVSLSYRVGF